MKLENKSIKKKEFNAKITLKRIRIKFDTKIK
jgi:hypothetical protein